MEISPTVHIRPPFWWVRRIPAALLIAGLIALTIVIGGNVLVPPIGRRGSCFRHRESDRGLRTHAAYHRRQVGVAPDAGLYRAHHCR